MDKMYDVPKKKLSKKKSKFPPNKGWGAANPNYVEDMMARGKPKARPTMVTPSRKKPGTGARELLPKKIGATPTKKLPKIVTGKEAALRKYQKSISPKGMAKTKKQQEDALKKLMEKRYRKKK
jgi:hypothetical protein